MYDKELMAWMRVNGVLAASRCLSCGRTIAEEATAERGLVIVWTVKCSQCESSPMMHVTLAELESQARKEEEQ